jgi:hypothetical protein
LIFENQYLKNPKYVDQVVEGEEVEVEMPLEEE